MEQSSGNTKATHGRDQQRNPGTYLESIRLDGAKMFGIKAWLERL